MLCRGHSFGLRYEVRTRSLFILIRTGVLWSFRGPSWTNHGWAGMSRLRDGSVFGPSSAVSFWILSFISRMEAE